MVVSKNANINALHRGTLSYEHKNNRKRNGTSRKRLVYFISLLKLNSLDVDERPNS